MRRLTCLTASHRNLRFPVLERVVPAAESRAPLDSGRRDSEERSMVGTVTRSPDPQPVSVLPDGPGGSARVTSRSISTVIVVGPAVALGVAVPLLWGRGIRLRDVLLGAVFYLMTAFGVTVGFHRLFTHRSFRANRPLKLVLAALG